MAFWHPLYGGYIIITHVPFFFFKHSFRELSAKDCIGIRFTVGLFWQIRSRYALLSYAMTRPLPLLIVSRAVTVTPWQSLKSSCRCQKFPHVKGREEPLGESDSTGLTGQSLNWHRNTEKSVISKSPKTGRHFLPEQFLQGHRGLEGAPWKVEGNVRAGCVCLSRTQSCTATDATQSSQERSSPALFLTRALSGIFYDVLALCEHHTPRSWETSIYKHWVDKLDDSIPPNHPKVFPWATQHSVEANLYSSMIQAHRLI